MTSIFARVVCKDRTSIICYFQVKCIENCSFSGPYQWDSTCQGDLGTEKLSADSFTQYELTLILAVQKKKKKIAIKIRRRNVNRRW